MTAGSGVVMVLGGGGAKAAAHAGALRALHEAGIRPARFAATSMGAVFGAMFAAGLSPDEVGNRVRVVRQDDVIRSDRLALLRGIWARALLRPEPLRATIERLVPARSFDQLRYPLTVAVTALDNGELLRFGAGGRPAPLIEVLAATCALPVYYPPILIEGRPCADGGLRSVVPLDLALEPPPELVVAVDVGPGFDATPASTTRVLPAIVQAHEDGMAILMASNTRAQLATWRATPDRPPLVYVRPGVERGATFRVDQVERYIGEGYRAARDALVGLRPKVE